MDEAHAQPGGKGVVVEIGQRMAECAEDERLVIRQLVLVGQDLEEGFDLRVMQVEVTRLVNKVFDLASDLGQEAISASPSLSLASRNSSRSSLLLSMSDRKGARPYRQLAACRRIVVIMNLTFCCPWHRARMRRSTSSTPSWRRSCAGVNWTSTVSGLRVVNSPMSRRRVRLMMRLKV